MAHAPHISTPHPLGKGFSLADLPIERKGPIIEPGMHEWMSKAVLNAGATLNDGEVTILFRGFGTGGPEFKDIPEGPSSIGWARSRDGITIDECLEHPVISNAEDPRITKFNGWYAVTYTKITGFEPPDKFSAHPAIATTRDLKNFKELGIMKVQGLKNVDKNIVLFPGMINGRYTAFARQKPDIYVVYSDDLIHWDSPEFTMGPRKGSWDNSFMGPGAPPIRTEYGWLNIYHATDEANTYRLGVSLHDLNKPSKVLARSIHPLLEPETDYECTSITGNLIHPNVVYTCGVVKVNGLLHIYYGGADQVLAVATVPLGLLNDKMRA